MNAQNLALAEGLVDAAYIRQGAQELRKRETLIRILLSQRCIPEEGWDDASIMHLLSQLSLMDSNNFSGAVGGGEREGRVASALVRNRHYGFGHGVGRSGDVAAVQPKAAGSSLVYKLTNRLALHAIQICGVTRAASALVLPMATGMSIAMVLLAARAQRPPTARFVVWPRIDQKSCFKAILTAGCTPVPVELTRDGDELRCDVAAIEAAIASVGGPNAVVAVVTTSSCFAPRGCDDLVGVAELCARIDVPHIVNHAYGLQAGGLCGTLNEACGAPGAVPSRRVDAFVSSSDKNFLVPVGGAIVAAPAESKLVEAVARSYPGRASLSPVLDLFITLLSLGQAGLRGLLSQRRDVAKKLKAGLAALAAAHGERVLSVPHNPISFAMSLGALCPAPASATPLPLASVTSDIVGEGSRGAIEHIENKTADQRNPLIISGSIPVSTSLTAVPSTEIGSSGDDDVAASLRMDGSGAALKRNSAPANEDAASLTSSRSAVPLHGGVSYLGSMLFSRGVSGTRAVPVWPHDREVRRIDGTTFVGYGAHCDAYPVPYLTVAAAVGMTDSDVDVLLRRLDGTLREFVKQTAAAPSVTR